MHSQCSQPPHYLVAACLESMRHIMRRSPAALSFTPRCLFGNRLHRQAGQTYLCARNVERTVSSVLKCTSSSVSGRCIISNCY